jgi:hypothetical protein
MAHGQRAKKNYRKLMGVQKCSRILFEERNGDIIKDTTPILQFWSEMQQTWHTYSQRPQNSETGINFLFCFQLSLLGPLKKDIF